MAKKRKQIPKQDSIKRYTITAMKELGTHKVQYNRIIDIYAGLVHQYLIALRDFEEGGYKYEVETGTGGTKKSPIVATLENLRKDILAYSDRLCLNPKTFESVTVETVKKSKLESVLESLEG